MSLPRARFTEPASTDSGPESTTGQLADTPLPELLARAYADAFSGTLVLEPPGAEPSNIRFDRGSVERTSGPWDSRELEWNVLSRLLPPEMLSLAAQHTEQYQIDALSAVERLALLPRESVDSAREALRVLGVQALCELPGDTRYTFLSSLERTSADSHLAAPIEPLGLIAACALVGPHKERVAHRIAAFENAYLSIDPDTSLFLLATVNGPLRAVVDCLAHSPQSARTLRDRNLVPADQLPACVYALWVTRQVVVSARGSSTPSWPSIPSTLPAEMAGPPSNPPVRSDSSPMMPSQRPGSSLPPRRESGFVRSDRAARERAMEDKVHDAWMLAQADPARTDKTIPLVLKAISIFPENPRLRFYSACLYKQANRIDDAVRAFEHALELDPEDSEARRELSQLRDSIAPTSPGARLKRLFSER